MNIKSTFFGRVDSKVSSLFTGQTRGLKQEYAIADLTRFKGMYEHLLETIKRDDSYVDTYTGWTLKQAIEYHERLKYSRPTTDELENAENIIEYIKEQMINDMLADFIARTNNYSSKASGRPISPAVRMDYDNSMRIVAKLKNTQYQLNSGNQISTYAEYERAYVDALNLIYATENSGEFRVNRANDTAIGIHRK